MFNYYNLNKNKINNLTIFYKSPLNNKNGELITPLSGLSNKLTILCNENGYFSQYLSDRYGFRNKDHVWDKDINWVLLGDSFVHGSCVNDEETIHNYLEKGLNEDIINLAIVGNNGYDQLGSYKEYLINKNPKNIIWFYFEGNDYNLSNNNNHHKIIKKYLLHNFSQNLIRNNKYINKNLEIEFEKKLGDYEKKNKIKMLKLTNLRLILNNTLPSLNLFPNKLNFIYKSEPTSENIEELKKIITKIKDLTKKNNQNLYFVYLPSFQRYYNKERFNDQTYYKKNEIISLLKYGDHNVIDIHEELFVNSKNPLNYFPYKDRKGHYTPEGYKAVSMIILKKILNNVNYK